MTPYTSLLLWNKVAHKPSKHEVHIAQLQAIMPSGARCLGEIAQRLLWNGHDRSRCGLALSGRYLVLLLDPLKRDEEYPYARTTLASVRNDAQAWNERHIVGDEGNGQSHTS